jgi:superfamily II DNA/RNA helicase
MSENYTKPKKSKTNPYASRDSARDFKKSGDKQRSFGGGGAQRSRFKQKPKASAKKFDPSMFIKKAEEQVVAESYIPKHTFLDFPIEQQLKDNIINRGYKLPTPIQDQVIPLLLQERDVIATANTGTGKTAAFLIPLVHNVLTGKTTRVLIIAPTRELADQIQGELKTFTVKTGLTSALIIGGASMGMQIKDLQKKPAFIIGTPGRLIDLEQQNVIRFNQFSSIVLDEVDTMLDMGFLKDVKYIIQKLPTRRHSLFFSATIPAGVQPIMKEFLANPATVSVKTRQTAANVNQDVIKVSHQNKVDVLHDLLIKPEFKKTIIFVRTKRSADKLAKVLTERGFVVASIHGDKSQPQRKKALDSFKANKVKILIATDVVARGIDVDDVSHVLNYDLPQTHEDYIHRIGRTGRAEKTGQALTFIE